MLKGPHASTSHEMAPPRFPPPWTYDDHNDACLIVRGGDHNQWNQHGGLRIARRSLEKCFLGPAP